MRRAGFRKGFPVEYHAPSVLYTSLRSGDLYGLVSMGIATASRLLLEDLLRVLYGRF